MPTSNPPQLKRGLRARHVQFIALGSAIGTGLFLGSGAAIQKAGPSVLLAYLIASVAVYIVMRALGEMAVYQPIPGSFSSYARNYLGPLAGFITGWTYAFEMIIVCVADVTAFGIYMGLWYPDVPRWVWVLGIICLIGLFNLMSVKLFGELEFWLSIIKVLAIAAMVIGGSILILFGFGESFQPTGISNLWTNGGFMPFGIDGMIASFAIVIFAFGGIEIIGITAAEAQNPQKVIPRAIKTIPIRLLLFYILTLFVLMSLYSWDSIGKTGSPFVNIFNALKIPYAADILNLIVISAAISAINSDIFGAGRMMFGMAKDGLAPKSFMHVSQNGVPRLTVAVMITALLCAVLLNYLIPDKVFIFIATIAAFATIWVWLMILLSHLAMRRAMPADETKKLKFPVPLWPVASILATLFLLSVCVIMAYFPDSRKAFYVGIIWIILLVVSYYLWIAKDKTDDNDAENQISTLSDC